MSKKKVTRQDKPRCADMRVPARIFTNATMLEDILLDRSLDQLVNVATLPGIQKYAYAMPDIHQGYGFPIGGVAGMAIEHGGVISPGGIGYDINCGVRLLTSSMKAEELKPYLEDLATALFDAVPSGAGRGGNLRFDGYELDKILAHGAHRMVELGYGTHRDLELCEEHGRMMGADPALVSVEAKKRGADQLGTLGSGNHFLEVQKVAEIYDAAAAQAFGIEQDMVTIMIHCGSRGLGHQTCTDYVRIMMGKIGEWGIHVPDRQLACAPFKTQEAQDYFAAMQASANFAWANRHCITHAVRQAWHNVVGQTELLLMYDISHNIAKVETHVVDGKSKDLVMHRKGATRAFGPGSIEVPAAYRAIGQPVLIPGTMGTSSYILAGTEDGMQQDFGSSCHGAGRRMSRMKAKKEVHGSTLRDQLEKQGIVVRCDSNVELAEEAPVAYKDIEHVVDVVVKAKIARTVARCVPIAVIKGG